ncbi:MAG: hypothetical protein CNLJKLNK_01336 [Holosporales bacterium]
MINFLLSFLLLISSVVADVGIDPSAMHQTVSLHCVEKIKDLPKGTKHPKTLAASGVGIGVQAVGAHCLQSA